MWARELAREISKWWAGRDSNPHAFRTWSTARRAAVAQPTHCGDGAGSELRPVVDPATEWMCAGADDGTRTRNLRFTKPLLYQLSYVGATGRAIPQRTGSGAEGMIWPAAGTGQARGVRGLRALGAGLDDGLDDGSPGSRASSGAARPWRSRAACPRGRTRRLVSAFVRRSPGSPARPGRLGRPSTTAAVERFAVTAKRSPWPSLVALATACAGGGFASLAGFGLRGASSAWRAWPPWAARTGMTARRFVVSRSAAVPAWSSPVSCLARLGGLGSAWPAGTCSARRVASASDFGAAVATRPPGEGSPSTAGPRIAPAPARRAAGARGRVERGRLASSGPSGSRWASASKSRMDPATGGVERARWRRASGSRMKRSHRRRTAGPEALALAADDERERSRAGRSGGR